MKDKQLESMIQAEYLRQKNNIELIASENFVSEAVMEARRYMMEMKNCCQS